MILVIGEILSPPSGPSPAASCKDQSTSDHFIWNAWHNMPTPWRHKESKVPHTFAIKQRSAEIRWSPNVTNYCKSTTYRITVTVSKQILFTRLQNVDPTRFPLITKWDFQTSLPRMQLQGWPTSLAQDSFLSCRQHHQYCITIPMLLCLLQVCILVSPWQLDLNLWPSFGSQKCDKSFICSCSLWGVFNKVCP